MSFFTHQLREASDHLYLFAQVANYNGTLRAKRVRDGIDRSFFNEEYERILQLAKATKNERDKRELEERAMSEKENAKEQLVKKRVRLDSRSERPSKREKLELGSTKRENRKRTYGIISI